MIKSMTGFGRCEAADEKRKFTVEMKGVNHRYLDANIRMPKKLNFFESAIRSLLKESVHRGKVDIFITYEDFSESQVSLKYNETLAAEYLEKFKMMEEKFSLENDIRVSTLSRYPEVLTMEEKMDDEEELWKGLKKALDGAIAQFVQTRTVEGENLKKDLIAKLDGMLELVGQIEERAPKIIAEYREKLEGKVKESRELQLKALPLVHALFSEVNPIPVKAALNLMGKEVGPLRMPLSEMEDANKAKLAEELKNFGIKLA